MLSAKKISKRARHSCRLCDYCVYTILEVLFSDVMIIIHWCSHFSNWYANKLDLNTDIMLIPFECYTIGTINKKYWLLVSQCFEDSPLWCHVKHIFLSMIQSRTLNNCKPTKDWLWTVIGCISLFIYSETKGIIKITYFNSYLE